MELADTPDLASGGKSREGSTPSERTKYMKTKRKETVPPNEQASMLRVTMDALRKIGRAKRNSVERRLARSTVDFIVNLKTPF